MRGLSDEWFALGDVNPWVVAGLLTVVEDSELVTLAVACSFPSFVVVETNAVVVEDVNDSVVETMDMVAAETHMCAKLIYVTILSIETI